MYEFINSLLDIGQIGLPIELGIKNQLSQIFGSSSSMITRT